MRRPGRRSKSPLGVSLFPFLAVLLCTMGSLIVLLICLVQQAEFSARSPEASIIEEEISPPESLTELENNVDDAEFAVDQLKQKKDEYAQTLAGIREEMAIAERLLREQEDEIKLLATQLVAIRSGDANEDALEAANEHADELRREIQALKTKLSVQEAANKAKPKQISIVRHQGKNGTSQRPIYIECLADKVVIQPEGVEFTDEDFLVAKSAGNPLDAALRAVREHHVSRRGAELEGAPYPLFIVRPGGDTHFLAARMAIVSWEDEYGYELIDEAVELAYPPPDDQLAEILRRSANDARKRQEALARALPGRFRAASGGASGGASGTSSQGGGPSGSATIASGNQKGRSGVGASRGALPVGSDATQPGTDSGADSRYLNGAADKAAKSRYSEDNSSGSAKEKIAGASTEQGAAKQGANNGQAGANGGAASAEIQRRGKNWANKEADLTATPAYRSIKVRCSAAQVVFMPPKGSDRKPIAIAWDGDPITVVDSIALQVRSRIASWGMAIGGGYWQPVLDVEVAPDGEDRFADLVAYFDQSGIEVRRKTR
jgi:hypothetical protein